VASSEYVANPAKLTASGMCPICAEMECNGPDRGCCLDCREDPCICVPPTESGS
jgi:hypothetical protein